MGANVDKRGNSLKIRDNRDKKEVWQRVANMWQFVAKKKQNPLFCGKIGVFVAKKRFATTFEIFENALFIGISGLCHSLPPFATQKISCIRACAESIKNPSIDGKFKKVYYLCIVKPDEYE